MILYYDKAFFKGEPQGCFPSKVIFNFTILFINYFNLPNTGQVATTKSSFFPQDIDCLLGNGKSYHGKMDTTKSGEKCVCWNKFPYLSNTSFLTLEKNYCRNPEGYGEKPWCYINKKNRTWEYCQIKTCAIGGETDEGEFFF